MYPYLVFIVYSIQLVEEVILN